MKNYLLKYSSVLTGMVRMLWDSPIKGAGTRFVELTRCFTSARRNQGERTVRSILRPDKPEWSNCTALPGVRRKRRVKIRRRFVMKKAMFAWEALRSRAG
jgi:hypothetical protein